MFSNFSKVVAIFFNCLQNASNGQKRVKNRHQSLLQENIRVNPAHIKCSKTKDTQGNWVAKNREQLIRRIKWAMAKFDQTTIVKMFDNLPDKIRSANVNGLNTLL